MRKKKIVAMLLAGGQGSRLGVLTNRMAKPAVPFGGKYRLIDFPLSNCVNSDIDTVGVLTQYEPLELNAYLGSGQAWDLDRASGGVYVLPPYVTNENTGHWYSGTANAVYQNLAFIEQYDPDNVLILSGDHIYKMNYAKMLSYHIGKQADVTIAVFKVPLSEAHRFGIMTTAPDGRIVEFEEKPQAPKNDRASMGVYIFSCDALKEFLALDALDPFSENDFGKNIIPAMVKAQKRAFAYDFDGYWKDVGTIQSLWEANMDMIADPPALDLKDKEWRIYCKSPIMPPHYAGKDAHIESSLITEGCEIYGSVTRSIVFAGATIDDGAVVSDSLILPNVHIKRNAIVRKAIVGENATIGENAFIGADALLQDGSYDTSLTGDITLIASGVAIDDNVRLPTGMIAKWGVQTEGGNG